jgi:hypothetical protein
MAYRYVAVLGICRVLILYAEEQERRKVAQERKCELLCFTFGCAGCSQQRVLIWLKATPNSDDLRELLKTEVFASEFWLTFAKMFDCMLQD